MNNKQYIDEEIKLLQELSTDSDFKLIKNVLLDAIKNNRIIYTAGNGGSSATASHITNDFNKSINLKFPDAHCHMICLSDNVPLITALSNDESYDKCYSEQLKFYGNENDILLIFSGSGNSQNLVNAINVSKQKNIKTIAVVAYDGGKCKNIADYALLVPTFDMQQAEDLHMIVAHLLYRNIMDEL